MFPQLRNDGGCKPEWVTAVQKYIGYPVHLLYPTDISVHLAGLSASQSPKFRQAVITHGIWSSLQNDFSYPQLQGNIFPTSCPCLFCQPFQFLLHLFPKCQSPTLTFHSEHLLKGLGLWICFEQGRATCCLFACGRHFCPLRRLKYCDRLKEKCVISRCVAGAVEQRK